MHKVIFTANTFSEEKITQLKEQGLEIIPQKADFNEDELIQALDGVEGYIAGGDEISTRRVIENAKDLKVIAFFGAGYEQYVDAQAAREHGIVVTNTPGANSQSVAEFSVALLLDAVKRVAAFNETAKKGLWQKKELWDLKGKTLGIVGMGHIGSRVASIMHNGFEMSVLYFSREEKPQVEQSLNAKRVSLDELMRNSDVVSLHLALNNETENIIGEKELSFMKPQAVLVNAARAKLVDGYALYKILEEGKIASAAFDVYYQEPLPKPEEDEYKLMSLPTEKFILTPHNAANSSDALEAMGQMCIESLLDVFEGREPKYRVNK